MPPRNLTLVRVHRQINGNQVDEILERTLCIVPMYNEEPVIEDVICDLISMFPRIVCIDDGGTDGSGCKATRAGSLTLRHAINLGQGAAIRTGIEFADRIGDVDYLVTFDADGQHCADDARRLLEHLVKNDLQIVFGSRFIGTSEAQIPSRKRVVLKFVVLLRRVVRRIQLTDVHNGLRAMRLDAARGLDLRHGGMAHASEFVRQARMQRLRIGEHPVTIRYTEYSKSKGQSLLNGVNILFELAMGRR
jgi:glycosyltransferase involved in cell wall biosynthesis